MNFCISSSDSYWVTYSPVPLIWMDYTLHLYFTAVFCLLKIWMSTIRFFVSGWIMSGVKEFTRTF